MKKRLWIAFWWGWSWWHVTPIDSLLEYYDRWLVASDKELSLFWFGWKKSLEEEYASRRDSVSFMPILNWKLRRWEWLLGLLKNCIDIWRLFIWTLQSVYYLLKYDISVVFCKWWYSALPLVLWAVILRKRILVHESDIHAWLVNKIAHFFADKTFVWFPDSLTPSDFVWQILSLHLETDFNQVLLEKPIDKKHILVLCWSQWSRHIFDELKSCLDSWSYDKQDYHFYVVCWLLNKNYLEVFSSYEQVTSFDYLDSQWLFDLYSQCSFAICRWSATILAELELFWIHKIIIPLPSHDQPLNWAYYVSEYWDVCLPQNFLSQLWQMLLNLTDKREGFVSSSHWISQVLETIRSFLR